MSFETERTKEAMGAREDRRERHGHEPYVRTPPGYRLPTDTRLGRVRLQVADLTRSLDYYQEVLGLRIIEETSGSAGLGAYGDDRMLIELFERRGARPAPQGGKFGLYHYAILLPTRADLARFAAHLIRTEVRFGASDHAVSEALYLRDPDGLGIEVYADRPRDAWPVHDGNLGMVTIPLDFESLSTAGDEGWQGMPAGTVMGHLHLHVGDIQLARRFYHEGLGFDEVFRMPSALFLSAGGYHHHLGTNTWASHAERPEAGDARLLEWTIVLPQDEEVEKAGRSLQEAGFEAERLDGYWIVTDPWNTSFRITASKAYL